LPEIEHVTVEVIPCEGESCVQPPVPGG